MGIRSNGVYCGGDWVDMEVRTFSHNFLTFYRDRIVANSSMKLALVRKGRREIRACLTGDCSNCPRSRSCRETTPSQPKIASSQKQTQTTTDNNNSNKNYNNSNNNSNNKERSERRGEREIEIRGWRVRRCNHWRGVK